MSAEKKSEKVEAPWDPIPPTPVTAGLRVEIPMDRDAVRRADFEKLRARFAPENVGKLPKVTCSVCAKEKKTGTKCQQHAKQKCNVCDAWISTAHVHLDYVGHAQITSRLLTVDPEWNWQPLATDEHGLPRFLLNGEGYPIGLWIRLTVLGVTRLGFGSVDGGAFDPEKQLIGDALRNAAMRFGVGLDLWSKEELETHAGEAPAVPAVDKTTGEVIAPTSRDEGDRMAAEVAAWGTEAPAPKSRVIEGIPIHTTKDWKAVSTLPLGGKNPFSAVPLGRIIAQDASETGDRDALDYFEETAVRGVLDLWNRMTPAKKQAGVGLPNECVLLAYAELMNRRSPPPNDTGKADL